MGGKNPTIVLADADFNAAVENVVNAAFFSTGQKCTATSRAIVEDAIYDKFVAAVVERTRKLKVGDGMQPGIEIGPCVDQAQMETVLRYIEIGRKECGEPAVRRAAAYRRRPRQGLLRRAHGVRGRRPKRTPSRGRKSSDRCWPSCAPLISKTPCASPTIFRSGSPLPFRPSNLSRAFEFIYRAEAGLLTVNLPSAGVEYQLPFGGTKDSSFGPKEQGPAALEFYSDYKTVYLKY